MATERLREVLAFVNHKGGVGKTTTVQNLATGLRRFGKGFFGVDVEGKRRVPRILIIDLDPQACASFLFGWSETQQMGKPTMYDALVQQGQIPVYQVREGIYLAPASGRLIGIEPFLNQMAVPRKALCKLLGKPLIEMQGTELADEGTMNVTEAFDYVLIDCPPAMSLLTHNALTAATSVVLPVQLEMLATKGIAEIINAVKETREDLNPNLDIRGLLMVMSNDQTNATKQFKQYLGEKFDDYMFDAYTRRDTKMVEAQAMNEDIFTYAPYSRVGLDYKKFTEEILESMPE
jgi:chromosome partitioning protein|uniref:ParA family protein n=1 Tax=Alloprevotella sp. TaxID=1872471 RepID=UPI003FED4C7C